jgi:hypothetical protein
MYVLKKRIDFTRCLANSRKGTMLHSSILMCPDDMPRFCSANIVAIQLDSSFRRTFIEREQRGNEVLWQKKKM